MGFYERLEELRKNVGIGQGKLEKELDIANGSISKWKNRTPKYPTLVKLSNYFGVSIDYLINGESSDSNSDIDNIKNENNNNNQKGMIIKAQNIRNLDARVDLFSGVGGLKKGLSPNTVCIQLADEPEIHMHSKFAYDLVKMMKDMPEEDLEFLANTAQRISPKPKKPKKVIVVENPANRLEKDIVPFPQYPSVTNKDIDEFAARNKKNKFTREEIAEKLYEMDKED